MQRSVVGGVLSAVLEDSHDQLAVALQESGVILARCRLASLAPKPLINFISFIRHTSHPRLRGVAWMSGVLTNRELQPREHT